MDATQRERRVGPVVEAEPVPGGDEVSVRDCATGDAFATVTVGDETTVATAVAAASAARPAVRETSLPGRAGWCERVATALREREAELADALVRETGAPIASARAEVAAAAQQFDCVADTARSLTGKYRTWTTAERAGDNSLVRAAPLGVVRCRPGAGAPLASAALQVAPAVAAGNAVVLTPPVTSAVAVSTLADILRETVPTGATGFVPTRVDSADPGAADAVLAAEPATGVTRFSQWFGGGDTALVYPDADLDAAADAVTEGGPSAVGRRLAGPVHVLAHESIQDALVDRIADRAAGWETGDPFAASTVVGRLPDRVVARRVRRQVDDAVAAGARLRCGGEVDGRTAEPTVLADVPRAATVRRERIPGPVVPVTPFATDAEALELATETGPLRVARVFTDRHSLAMDVADAVDAGTVHVNGGPADDAGVGLDRETAAAAIDRLTHTRRVRD